MTKAVYLGDNNSRKIKKIYEGNGTAHKIKKGYIGDSSGKARLFFTSINVWQKYTAVDTGEYRAVGRIVSNVQTFSDNISYITTDPSLAPIYQKGEYFPGAFKIGHQSTPDISIIKPGWWISPSIAMVTYTFERVASVNVSNRSVNTDYEYRTQYFQEYSKGELIGTVESDDENAYPTNGRHTDGYWYVKVSK